MILLLKNYLTNEGTNEKPILFELVEVLGYPYKWQIWSIIVPIQGTSDMHERILKIPLEFL